MKRLIRESQDIVYAMSNMVGKYVKLDGPLSFSFYFGTKDAFSTENSHGIRVKICPNRERYQPNNVSELELHGEYKLHNTAMIKKVVENEARTFFKKYKVLFAGVWEKVLLEENIVGYFKNRATLDDIVEESYLTKKQKSLLRSVSSIEKFEEIVRRYSMFNMND